MVCNRLLAAVHPIVVSLHRPLALSADRISASISERGETLPNSRLSFLLVVVLACLEQFRVDLHEQLERVVHHAVDGARFASAATVRHQSRSHLPVPVCSRVRVQGREDDGENDSDVLAHQVDDVFVVPVIQSPFRDLAS